MSTSKLVSRKRHRPNARAPAPSRARAPCACHRRREALPDRASRLPQCPRLRRASAPRTWRRVRRPGPPCRWRAPAVRRLVAGQPRNCADRIDTDEIRSGENVSVITLRDVYAADQRMRQRTAHEGNVLQPGEADVGHELATTAHQPIVFLSRQPRADALSGARSACGRKLALIAHGGILPDRPDVTSLGRNGLRQNWCNRVVSRSRRRRARHR